MIESERLKYEMHITYKLKTERKRKENGGMMKAFLILEAGMSLPEPALVHKKK